MSARRCAYGAVPPFVRGHHTLVRERLRHHSTASHNFADSVLDTPSASDPCIYPPVPSLRARADDLPDASAFKSPHQPRCKFPQSPQRPLLKPDATFQLYEPPLADKFKQPRQPAVGLHWGGASDHGRGHQTAAHTPVGVSTVGGFSASDEGPVTAARPRTLPRAIEPLSRAPPSVPSWVERVATPRTGWTGRSPPRKIARGYDAITYR